MNRENTLKLIEAIEKGIPNVYFDMRDVSRGVYRNRETGEVYENPYGAYDMSLEEMPLRPEAEECGTARCIKGYAEILSGYAEHYGNYPKPNELSGENWLELTEDQADRLFYPINADDEFYQRQILKAGGDPWEGETAPISLTGTEGAAKAVQALKKALELWGD